MNNVIKFPGVTPARSKEAELWDAYLVSAHEIQSDVFTLNIEKMRKCVKAFDAFMEEYTKDTMGQHGSN